MKQKNQSKQPNWLMVAVVTTMVGGVVQVIVNHVDNIVAFLGENFSQIHLSIGVSTVANVISGLATIGGAGASLLAYRYAKRARKYENKIKQIITILDETTVISYEPVPIHFEPLPTIEEMFSRMEEQGKASVSEVPRPSEKPEDS